MKKRWEIDVEGTKHVIEYKAGFGIKLLVDGELHKVKSSNWFINMVDYSIQFGSTECHVVAIGNKVDVAVNGTYLGSGEAYEPLASTPGWVYVLVGLSVIGGYFMVGLMGLLVGILMSTMYVKMALKKKTGAVIGLFAGCTVIQIIIFFLVVFARVSTGI